MTPPQTKTFGARAALTDHRDPGPVAEGAAHHAFGLSIRSQIPLPELRPGDGGRAPDLLILRETPAAGPIAHEIRFGARSATLAWPAVGAFRVEADRIVATPAHGVADDLLALPLLGPVMATFLHLRGQYLLHASAVAVGSVGAAMMGDKGAGKSSLASALLGAGHPLVTDDLVAFDTVGDRILPGFPQMKLGAEGRARLADPDARVRPQVHEALDKDRVLIGRFRDAPTPVARLYVIVRGDAARVEPLTPEASLAMVLRFAWAARFGRQALVGEAAARHFRAAAALAKRDLVRRLVVPDGLDRLPEAVSAIERDIRNGPPDTADSSS